MNSSPNPPRLGGTHRFQRQEPTVSQFPWLAIKLFFSTSPKTLSLRFDLTPVHRGQVFGISLFPNLWIKCLINWLPLFLFLKKKMFRAPFFSDCTFGHIYRFCYSVFLLPLFSSTFEITIFIFSLIQELFRKVCLNFWLGIWTLLLLFLISINYIKSV